MRIKIAYLALAAMSGLPGPGLTQAADDPRLIESRAITDEFARRLQSALQEAIGEGGPSAAIDVCKTDAIEIASELSRRHGARISRTSLKLRNPLNLPEPWQAAVLRRFELDAADRGNPPAPAEYYYDGGDGPVRYMRAIRTGGLCLACHGTAIPAEVAAELDREYPFDLARGYEAGDLRGAFSVIWPEEPADSPDGSTP